MTQDRTAPVTQASWNHADGQPTRQGQHLGPRCLTGALNSSPPVLGISSTIQLSDGTEVGFLNMETLLRSLKAWDP